MRLEDILSIVSHLVNFSIAGYLISMVFITNTIELINPTLTLLGLILAVGLNVIGVVAVLNRKNNNRK